MPKKPVTKHLWAVNMIKVPRHCLNPHGSIIVIFFDQSEKISAR